MDMCKYSQQCGKQVLEGTQKSHSRKFKVLCGFIMFRTYTTHCNNFGTLLDLFQSFSIEKAKEKHGKTGEELL